MGSMKKILTALVAMMAMCSVATAQDVVRDSTAVADTAADEPNVIGGRVDSTYLKQRAQSKNKKEQNIIGTPVYYDLDGQQRTTGLRPSQLRQSGSREAYIRPKHHYFNSLKDQYCGFFVETELLLGMHDVAAGANFTYLPDRWGAYASLLGGARGSYLSAGPALRLSGYDDDIDWHLYGGVMFSPRHLGAEAGLRIASPQRRGDFCWMSGSMGLGVAGGDVYVTLGFSLEILAVTALSSLLFW